MAEFAGRHNRRPMDTADMMAASTCGMVGERLLYAELTAVPPEPGQLEFALN